MSVRSVRGEPATFEALDAGFPLMEAVPDPLVVVSADGRIVAANDRFCVLSRYAREDLVGAPIEMLVPDRLRAGHAALRAAGAMSESIARPMTKRLDLHLRRADSVLVPVGIALSNLSYGGRPLIVATVRDTSARVEMQTSLERERAFLRAMNAVSNALLDSDELQTVLGLVTELGRELLESDVAITVVDSPDDVGASLVRASDGVGAAALLGRRLPVGPVAEGRARRGVAPELIADASTDALVSRVPGWPAGMGAALVVPLHARGKVYGGMTFARRDGRAPFLPTDVSAAVALAEKATFAIALDRSQGLSERARRWRAVATRSTKEVEQQRLMLQRMEVNGRAKGEILAKVAHELRAPLTSVKGYVELLGDRTDDETNLRMLEIVARNSDRLTSLVDDLLTMSLADAGILQLELADVDVSVIVEHVRDTVMPSVAKSGLALDLDLEARGTVRGDRDKLERALLNLVSNAVKFTPLGGRIEVATHVDDADIVITVADSGPGIPADEQDLLFTRFFRTARSRSEQVPGIGLGLYIVDQIVELHGGRMEVASSAYGSTFTMRLPIGGPPS